MNILNHVTWQAMWKNKVRTIVTIVGIILSAAMFSAVTTLGFSLWTYLVDVEIYGSGDYFLRYDYTSREHLEELRRDDRVAELGDLGILGYTTFVLEHENGNISDETCVVAAGDDAFYDMVTVILEEGRLPEHGSEIVISRNIYWYLHEGGKPCEVGETVELNVVPEYAEASMALPADGEAFTKTYTIVGIAEYFTRLDDHGLYLSHLFTYADGNEGDALWHRGYVKTTVPVYAYELKNEKPEGAAAHTSETLLHFYGASQYGNYNLIIAAICGVLIAIIMVGSVCLIYNAFSISVAERTKQFGLLSSVGATKKQIRHSVYFEAMVLSAMGIPMGILCGYGGIAVTLEVLKSVTDSLFDSTGGNVTLRAVPSLWMFLAAGLVALITVMISAQIPARRATKVSPLSAIRQTQDYQIPKQGIKDGKPAGKLWGLPGLMARKYYTVSKKKYRATIISLAVSIVLFITATSIVGAIQTVAGSNVNTNSFDMKCHNLTQEEIDGIRGQESVERSALYGQKSFVTVIPAEEQARDYLEVYDSAESHYSDSYSREVKMLNIYYLEDAVLRAYLEEHHIDPEPYFDKECPTALVYRPDTTDYKVDPETGGMTRYTYRTDLVAEGVETLVLYPDQCPDEVRSHIRGILGEFVYAKAPTEDMLVYAFSPAQELSGSGIISAPGSSEDAVRVAVIAEENEAGQTAYSYYLYDVERDKLADTPICTVEGSEDIPVFKLGAMIDESPFGLRSGYMADIGTVELILPLSAAGAIEKDDLTLSIAINNYDAIAAYLMGEDIPYDDYLAGEMQSRNVILMINVFSYGFIILISLICVANVFNTISTNIALRRRDFGMLRSAGMKTGELYRMVSYECLIYGFRALLWGMPISLLASYGIYRITSGAISEPFMPPWGAIVIAVACVFLIVFITMFYAVTKLRKDNPIDAVRMENI